jgi:hypothetical protein
MHRHKKLSQTAGCRKPEKADNGALYLYSKINAMTKI